MPAEPLYPLAFAPIVKSLIWGGRRLGTVLGKPIGTDQRYAESWEISDHRDNVSLIENGPLAGTGLRDLVRQRGAELLGPGLVDSLPKKGQFPLLVKFLDANEVLSVQVHPDDAKGRVLADDNGKTEAWVIVHAEPGSLIYAGLRQGVTRDDFARAMESGEVEPLLHRFEAKEGDCVMIPAGTMHAIGAGIVLAEIQQMSDATFRVFDWGRLGPDGQPRTLHPSQALACTDFEAGPVDPVQPKLESTDFGSRERLASCPYFAIERLKLRAPALIGRDDRFTIVLGLGGSAEIVYQGTTTPLGFGRTILLPAAVGPCEVRPQGEGVTLLTCVVP